MKALFREIFEVLGAEVTELPPHELHVKVPKHSRAGCLLQAQSSQLLSFSPENKNPGAIIVTPGSTLLETATLKLSHMGATRHGVLPAQCPDSRKNLKNRCQAFGRTEQKFSCRRGWKVTVRMWLKIKFSGDETIEILEGFEIPADGQPIKLERIISADKEVRWVDKPPLKLFQLKQIIEAGFRFAENFIIEKAADWQKKNLKTLYPALERLRIYYHQLAQDAAGNDGQPTGAIEAEYRRRLREEIQYAGLKATADLTALETISTPVQNLKWQLQRNGKSKEVNAVLNLYDGSFESTTRCEICGGDSSFFGISESNVLVCASCCCQCDICGAEIVARQALTDCICSICGQTICLNCLEHCAGCGRKFCLGHIEEGRCHTCQTTNSQMNLF